MRDDRKTLGRKWLGILAVCFVVVALAVIAFAARRADSNTRDAAAQKEVQERLASLRLANQPISFQDLAARYPDPPPEHDAELLLQPTLAAFVKPKGENLPYFGSQWPASDAPIDGGKIGFVHQAQTLMCDRAFGQILQMVLHGIVGH